MPRRRQLVLKHPSGPLWEDANRSAEIFAALACASRLCILNRFVWQANGRPLSGTKMGAALRLSQPAISWHWIRLRTVGLVTQDPEDAGAHQIDWGLLEEVAALLRSLAEEVDRREL